MNVKDKGILRKWDINLVRKWGFFRFLKKKSFYLFPVGSKFH